MLTGRPELIQQAVPLLPTSTRLDTLNAQGHTALMLAAIHNDDITLQVWLLRNYYPGGMLIKMFFTGAPGRWRVRRRRDACAVVAFLQRRQRRDAALDGLDVRRCQGSHEVRAHSAGEGR